MYEQLYEYIDSKVTTNGKKDITGDVMNKVLKTIVDAIAEQGGLTVGVGVQLTFNVTMGMEVAYAQWPFEDTDLGDVLMTGGDYTHVFPVNGTRIETRDSFAIYDEDAFYGTLTSLQHGATFRVKLPNDTKILPEDTFVLTLRPKTNADNVPNTNLREDR